MVGRRLGHYQILEKLGRGGMGEVYRARDEHLSREVALKILPASLVSDPERLLRFRREAQLLASLNHSNVAQVYGLETEDAASVGGAVGPYLILELIEGETLSRRISRDGLSLDETLEIGRQLAEGLDTAHRKGIIHRDLKPSNIMLTKTGQVKILDFGLAKLMETQGPAQDLSHSPTITGDLTRSGVMLGTAAYMSPEAAQGKEADRRSDIWAFGCILFECLAGRQAFYGKTVTEVLASLLVREPDWGLLPAETPEPIRRLLRRCLAKDPNRRLHDIADAMIELLEATLPESSEAVGTTDRGTGPIWVLLLALACLPLAATAAVAGWYLGSDSSQEPAQVIRSSISLPDGERLAWTTRHAVAVSPDGQWLAYGSYDYKVGGGHAPIGPYKVEEGNAPIGQGVINLRRLDQTEVRRIPGFNPFFSPDSRELGFLKSAGSGQFELKRTRVEGGPFEQVAVFEDPDQGGGFGLAWLPDGTIVFSPRESAGLYTVMAVGGDPRPLTHLDAKAGEYDHRLPSVLPDGRTILYTELRYSSDNWAQARIVALRLDTGEKKELIEGGADGRYVSSGHLVFAREGRLMAVRFDAERLEVSGVPVPVLDGVAHSVHWGASQNNTGAAQFGVSREGLLAFGSGSVHPERTKEIVWVDRKGREEPAGIEPKSWLTARIAPNGREALLSTLYTPRTVWLYDLERKVLRRQSFEGESSAALWGPGKGEFTSRFYAEGPPGIYVKPVDSGPLLGENLAAGTSNDDWPSSWHPDGRRLAVVNYSAESGSDIWILDRQGGRQPFLQTRFNEWSPEFSPDGRWLAYTSDESGRDEVYVRPFPGPGKPVQISTAGGREPCWSRNGNELFFLSLFLFDPVLNQQPYFSARISVNGNELYADPPQRLFAGRYMGANPVRSFGVGADGRFLLIKREAETVASIWEAHAPPRIELIQNWFEELRSKVPAK